MPTPPISDGKGAKKKNNLFLNLHFPIFAFLVHRHPNRRHYRRRRRNSNLPIRQLWAWFGQRPLPLRKNHRRRHHHHQHHHHGLPARKTFRQLVE